MNVTKEDILNAIAQMSISDVCDLVKMIEKKFDISAQPIAAPAAASNQDSKESTEEQTEFDVVVTAAGSNRISTIKTIRSITSLGLKEAKEAIESLPFSVKEGVTKEEAETMKKKLEEAGATVEIK